MRLVSLLKLVIVARLENRVRIGKTSEPEELYSELCELLPVAAIQIQMGGGAAFHTCPNRCCLGCPLRTSSRLQIPFNMNLFSRENQTSTFKV